MHLAATLRATAVTTTYASLNLISKKIMDLFVGIGGKIFCVNMSKDGDSQLKCAIYAKILDKFALTTIFFGYIIRAFLILLEVPSSTS